VKKTSLPFRRAMVLGVSGVAIAATLAACGGGSSGTPKAAAGTAAAGSVATPTQSTSAGRFDSAEMQKIQACLSAAGITLPTPTHTFNPSDRPTGRPSGAPSGGGDGFGNRGMFADPQVRTALEACGIALPTGRPTGAPGSTGAPGPDGGPDPDGGPAAVPTNSAVPTN
jgi:hypothetical protein